MGFGKKVHEAIRVVSVKAEKSIDWSQTPRLDYIESRNEELLVFNPDEDEPIWFHLIPSLAPGTLARLASYPGDEKYLRAFQFGVTDVSPNVLGLEWDRMQDIKHITDKSCAGVPAKVWKEIGKLIIQREDLSVGESPRFAL